MLVVLLWCRAFVLRLSDGVVGRVFQMGIVFAIQYVALYFKKKPTKQTIQPQLSSKFPVNRAFSGRIKL